MKALILEQNAQLRYKEIAEPAEEKGMYLIKVIAAGICGSDIHRGFENGAYHYPLVMGHEFSGRIVAVPAGGKYKKGSLVTVFPLLPCKTCNPCSTGDYAQCANYDYYGSRRDGGFAEYVSVPEENLFAVPEGVDPFHAAMTEPCAVALHGVRKLRMSGGETAAVYGSGPIGNMVAQWLRILGCAKVAVIDIDEAKLELASKMGFIPVNARVSDPVKAIADLTNGNGAMKVVEACGIPVTMRQAVLSAARFGEVVLLGNASGDLVLKPSDLSSILRKEIIIHGTWNSKVTPRGGDDWTTVLEYMRKGLDLAPLISHTPRLSEGAEIFDIVVGKREPVNKVIFKIAEAY